MAQGTKNRLLQNADICRQHLRETHAECPELVEEFILEIEGPEHENDPAQWSRFADIKQSTTEMRQRVDAAFNGWLAGEESV